MQNEKSAMNNSSKRENLDRIKNKILIMSGKGGVGKSTVTVNISYALASLGYKTGILDIDFHGPSIAKMTGIEGRAINFSSNGRPLPVVSDNNIHILSLASLLKNTDDAVIWRGPLKISAIQQFFEDFEWPELDFLIIDCPPGTGDEPLSIIQTIEDVTGAIIVSTPQDVALLDARKSITFSQKLNVHIIGIIENMAGFICPKCGEKINIFKSGGVEKTARDFNIEILGHIPIEADIVESGDNGKPFVISSENTEVGKIFMGIAKRIAQAVQVQENAETNKKTINTAEKIAIPVDNGLVSAHFGHAGLFAIYHIGNGTVLNKEELTPPPHEPGSIPKWLNEVGATKIITGGIGQSAINFFNSYGIDVLSGAPEINPDDLIKSHLNNEITFSESACSHDHSHDHGHDCGH